MRTVRCCWQWELCKHTQPLLNIHTWLSNLFFGILEIPRFWDQSCCSRGRHYSLGWNMAKVISVIVMPIIVSSRFAPHCFSIRDKVYASDRCLKAQMYPCQQALEAPTGGLWETELVSLKSVLLLSLQMVSALQSGTALSVGPKVLRVNSYLPRALTTSMTSTTKVRPVKGPAWKNQWPWVGRRHIANKVIPMYLSEIVLYPHVKYPH